MLAACRSRGFNPARILEPTCGSGSFLRAAAAEFPAAEIIGIEYQRRRYGELLDATLQTHPQVRVHYDNAYTIDFGALEWRTDGPLLIVGNPPWVTAAALGRVAGALQPPRSNHQRLRGLAARTGAANFDVAEFLLQKLLRELRDEPLRLAVLVKESVARNVLDVVAGRQLDVASAEIVRIDARAWFGVGVDACCLLLSVKPANRIRAEPALVRSEFAGGVVAHYEPRAARVLRTAGPVFRQGIKHDAAAVFELRLDEAGWRNGYGEDVDIESDFIYPLRKARALHSGEIEPTALIVPQQRLGEATSGLQTRAPRLWRYLHAHAERIAARKSSIYRNAPAFAIFGIGPYSFAPWKVGVAGLYAEPRFRLIGPQNGRPVVLGDTAYFAGFGNEADARSFSALCADSRIAAVLRERIVRGKRPVTKALLDAVDWAAAARSFASPSDRLHTLLREPLAP